MLLNTNFKLSKTVNPNMFFERVGKNIALARKARNLTQKELGDRASLTRQSIALIEKGQPSKNFLEVVWALGLEELLLDSISPKNDELGRSLAFGSLPKRVSKARGSVSDEF
jgi:transcriptional regulator with XRE-family HTH domain